MSLPTLRIRRSRINLGGAVFGRVTRATVCLASLAAASLLSLTPLAAWGAAAPATIDPEASCTTGGCHADTKAKPKLHGPVAGDACQGCHEPKGKEHNFAKISDIPALCTKCHDKVDGAANVHPPAQGDCLVCHDPHGSKVAGMLKADDQKALCFSCHEDAILKGEYQHGPAAVGACSVCHNPHSSAQEKLLRSPGNELCATCHADLVKDMTSGANVHEPVRKGCVSCHNPHSGPKPKMLPGSTQELCAKCHEKQVKAAKESAVPHGPAAEDGGCTKCHTPHGSNNRPLLKAAQTDLCVGCHDKPLEAGKTKLTNMKQLLADNKEWHGPIRDGGCTGCHEAHGGANFRLLKQPYPATFYSAYQPDNYALCFTCHEPMMAKEEFTKTLTGFRDGDRNMHFLHVNKADRGRTCRACHEVHASTHPRHIRESVPYGNWSLPINFAITEQGGSCQPGCHAAKTYDRSKKN
ncbi:MAG: cytochrome c3 family protein [Candidatus Hydrogenedentes bacterium]|nr:cytochrome c3 family protein [Candidatus Hydrogenedentota bacterium]